MSTITLSANKINMMPLLIIDASNAVKSYKSELQTLKLKLLTIDNSVCNVDDVISSIKQEVLHPLTRVLACRLHSCPSADGATHVIV